MLYFMYPHFIMKGGDSVMGDLNLMSIGNFLAVVLQGILIHVISHMLIEFLKNKK